MKTILLSAAALLALLPRGAVAQSLLAPTKEHEEMAREVGVWEGEVKMWTSPDAEPMLSRGVETISLLGKVWLVGRYESDFGGQPFHGQSQTTYDPLTKKYVGTWIDSMAPTLMTLSGDYDAATHTLTMTMKGVDAMTGKPGAWKTITRYVSDDAKNFEIHAPVEGQDGKWWKMMEVSYKRKK